MNSRAEQVVFWGLALLFLLAVWVPFAATAVAEPATTAPAQKTPDSVAQEFVRLLADGRYSTAGKMLDATMRAAVNDEQLAAIWRDLAAKYGDCKDVKPSQVMPYGQIHLVLVTCDFANATVVLRVATTSRAQISGLFIQSGVPKEFHVPPYADRAAFTEREVTVGSGQWALPGTLSLPNAPRPCPAVVLVHGSGPQDRDETIEVNKPFRDLAWGLASRGVAVLRYDKRTLAHRKQLAASPDKPITTKEEVTDDALAAVALLRQTREIDPARIFVLGHSLGGTLIPRIAAGDSGIAGFISMAGATAPIEEAIVRQTRYILSLSGPMTPEAQAHLDALVAQVKRVKAIEPGGSPSELILGAPAAYWLDLRDYDPAAAAQAIKTPMLFLQGGRDYQVTDEDFARWQVKLSDRENVTFKTYPALNHLFIPGGGKPSPAEYGQVGHVAAETISDIANWINGKAVR